MGSISDIGNGYGLLYQVEKDTLKILTVSKNDKDGERSMKNIAVIDAPLSASRAATGLIEVVAVDSTGTIDTIEVNGVDILGSPYSVTTNDPETEAIGIAAAINAYTPLSGYKYTASNVGGIVYLQSPLDVGAVANGFEIDVTVSDVSIETETTDFSGGATTTTVYDSLIGRRYYLNADYNASGVTNTLAAPVNALTNAIEITKYIVTRGMQVGIPSESLEIEDDGISPNRTAAYQLYIVDGEGSANDNLVYINTEDFLLGDMLIVKAADGVTITVESEATTTSINQYKNIRLINNERYVMSGVTKAICFQYLFDDATSKGVFVELYRAERSEFIADTYANLEILRAASLLLPNNVYKITDRGDLGIIVRADSVNSFALHATFLANYTGGGQLGTTPHETCEWSFADESFISRVSSGNLVSNGAVSGAIYGYATISNNVIEGGLFVNAVGITMSTIIIISNYFKNATLQLIANGAGILQCDVQNSKVGIDNSGAFSNCSFYNCANIYTQLSANVNSCIFSNIPNLFSINRNVSNCTFQDIFNYDYYISELSQTNKVWIDKLNTLTGALAITAAKYLIFAGGEYIGYVTPDATFGATIDGIINDVGPTLALSTVGMYHNIRVMPASGNTVTIKDYSIATATLKNVKLSAASTATLVLDGSKGDWAEFEFNTTTYMWSLVTYYKGI